MKNSSKTLRRRNSENSQLLKESFENPESTPVHITSNQLVDNLAVHSAIDEIVKQQNSQQNESKLLSDPLKFPSERMETAC